ncbi:ComF family protein [Candidatus Saccharibacteria bacterium]|nr:ComF family protein [Candidatus Saccharibacteria bacterium]
MRILEDILNILAPNECIVCQEEGTTICEQCSEQAIFPVPSRCYRCKKLTNDFAVCKKCKNSSKLSNVWVRSEYSNVSKQLIYKMKFDSNRQTAHDIARLDIEVLPYFPKDVIVCPIPTATMRVRQRGYDHTMEIAKEISKITGLHKANLLVRVGKSRQVGARKEARINQLKDSFIVTKDVKNRKVILVDDVVTTGGTLESAASELKRFGASRVYAVVFAQK